MRFSATCKSVNLEIYSYTAIGAHNAPCNKNGSGRRPPDPLKQASPLFRATPELQTTFDWLPLLHVTSQANSTTSVSLAQEGAVCRVMRIVASCALHLD